MPVVIGSSIVLDPVETGPDHPLIGYDTIVTTANIAATTAEANYPVSNLANPATHLEWRGTSAIQHYLTVTTDGVTPLDYLAVARHNFGSAGIAVSIEGYIGGVWTEIEPPRLLADDSPIMWRIELQALPQVRIRLQAGSTAPRAAVLYVGRLLVMERRIYSGHVPITYARKLVVSNNRSESGQFLGRIVTGEDRETTASFKLFTPAWYRENMPAFLLAAKERPFFFAWRPASYVDEIGYCWLTDDPMPANQDAGSNNLVAFDLKLGGVA